MPGNFFDSNTLIYTVSTEEAKAQRARTLVRMSGTISVQVLNEIANVGRRKLHLDWDGIDRLLKPFRRLLRVVDLTETTHIDDLRLAARYGFAVYDGMIVAAAVASGCETLWSEDMHDGLVVDGALTIRNPFT